jgi:hypothetical protein
MYTCNCSDFSYISNLVVRVPDYSSRGSRFDSWHYQIILEVVGLEQSSLSLVRIIDELLGRNSSNWKK